ncbi:teichoic acid transport system ATP-binding protein [Corynebacterium mycetoides]|uniref:Teichoic acid transport system ATP-binding protein n=1 Tax=Corynebacterium mycetoides TaxID=38302 RepID=A0A1G9NJP9_9CORY|nr:ABC transporter ATP-binding protein [Corynebacterium mycetoides]SDL86649.1 teichoic acid transport system ATP-binding protein [Corynebacterium mycetoides]
MPRHSKDGGSEFVEDPAVVLREATKIYAVTDSKSIDAGGKSGGKRPRYVHSLKPTNLVAVRGESIGVIGRNGSGKSTLLKLIAGSETATRGEVLVKSQPMLLGVSPALQPYLTGRQNVILGCLALGMTRAEAEELEPDISNWADIGDAIERPLKTYSAGQGARLSFAISTAVKPEILLVDEALSTGDAAFAEKASERMSKLLEDAGNLFLVSHSAEQVLSNCARAVWVHRGEIIADGSSDEIVSLYQEWTGLVKSGRDAGYIENIRADYIRPQITFSS